MIKKVEEKKAINEERKDMSEEKKGYFQDMRRQLHSSFENVGRFLFKAI